MVWYVIMRYGLVYGMVWYMLWYITAPEVAIVWHSRPVLFPRQCTALLGGSCALCYAAFWYSMVLGNMIAWRYVLALGIVYSPVWSSVV